MDFLYKNFLMKKGMITYRLGKKSPCRTELRLSESSLLKQQGVEGFLYQEFFMKKGMIAYRIEEERTYMTDIRSP